jgi:signal transduction histidine kinase
MTVRARHGSIPFRPRARLLKLIGEELISDEALAIGELVKNSHDADASKVRVCFTGVTAPGGQIEVRDDGCGMDLDTLLERWMQPAASTKVGKGRQITRRGRRVLGEKGVGRFAADKLARHLEILSRRSDQREEIRAVVDWDQFDTDRLMLNEVEAQWEVRPAQILRSQGTILRLAGVRTVWSEKMFRRLSLRLSRLLSPFRKADNFTIEIESDEFPQYAGELRADYLKKAPYRIEASFDGLETISLSVNGRRALTQRWNGQGELACGPVRMRVYVFDLEGEAVARIGPRMEVRSWLREWTGVSIYRDGFRVLPYGEPHDDWLRLDQRRVNNPVERLSNNQVIGFIEIGRDANPDLLDQTNREGLIHNQAFEDLRRLAYFVLQAIEAERQSIRHPVTRADTESSASKNGASSVGSELESLAGLVGDKLGKQLTQLKKNLDQQVNREAVQAKQIISGYRGLATMGQLAAGLVPIAALEVTSLQSEIAALRACLNGQNSPRSREVISKIEESCTRMKQQLQILAATGKADRRRTIDVMAEIQGFKQIVEPFLKKSNVDLDVIIQDHQLLRVDMRPESFFCLLEILTANSLDWLRGVKGGCIRIALAWNPESVELTFSDNGPGVPFQLGNRIFEPLFTRKESGRGMGLVIARQLVESHGGRIELKMDGRRRGANFQIVLPRKRARATVHHRQ